MKGGSDGREDSQRKQSTHCVEHHMKRCKPLPQITPDCHDSAPLSNSKVPHETIDPVKPSVSSSPNSSPLSIITLSTFGFAEKAMRGGRPMPKSKKVMVSARPVGACRPHDTFFDQRGCPDKGRVPRACANTCRSTMRRPCSAEDPFDRNRVRQTNKSRSLSKRQTKRPLLLLRLRTDCLSIPWQTQPLVCLVLVNRLFAAALRYVAAHYERLEHGN